MVCGTDRDPSGDDSVLVNCGLGEPVRLTVAAGTAPAVGEMRAVALNRSDTAGAWEAHGVYPLAPAPPRPGERRRAVVTAIPEFPWLQVTVAGSDIYPVR